MPMPIQLAHGICRRLADVRRGGTIPLRPDGKSQVTVEYDASGAPRRVHTVLVSTQHDPDIGPDELRDAVVASVVRSAIPAELLDERTRYLVNPTGRFVIGGPHGDAGLTGRKIIVDTYGGMGRHGGGAFSGKDPTKVDRSAAYAARWAAKHVVAAGLAGRCEIQLAYAIGVAQPVSVRVDTFGTATVDEEAIETALREVFDFTPRGIIESLGLRAPIYQCTAAYGHFGRACEMGGNGKPVKLFPWEETSRVDDLRTAAKA